MLFNETTYKATEGITDTDTNPTESMEPTDTQDTAIATTTANILNKFTPTVFNNPLFGKLTVLKDTNGKLWFIGIEVARMLGYKQPSLAIRDLVSKDHRLLVNIKFILNIKSGYPYKTIISEQGLIELINRPKKRKNQYIDKFKEWLCDVGVDFKKYGITVTPQSSDINSTDNVDEDKKIINDQMKILDQIQPAIDYYNENVKFDKTITISQIADEFGMTAQAMNTLLCSLGFHHPIGQGWVINEKYKDKDLVKIKVSWLKDENGNNVQPYEFITGYTEKGHTLIRNLIKNNQDFLYQPNPMIQHPPIPEPVPMYGPMTSQPIEEKMMSPDIPVQPPQHPPKQEPKNDIPHQPVQPRQTIQIPATNIQCYPKRIILEF